MSMRRSHVCSQCGKLVSGSQVTCPRCGSELPLPPAVQKEQNPPFEHFLEEPFARLETVVELRYGERLESLAERLASLERELDSFLEGR